MLDFTLPATSQGLVQLHPTTAGGVDKEGKFSFNITPDLPNGCCVHVQLLGHEPSEGGDAFGGAVGDGQRDFENICWEDKI